MALPFRFCYPSQYAICKIQADGDGSGAAVEGIVAVEPDVVGEELGFGLGGGLQDGFAGGDLEVQVIE